MFTVGLLVQDADLEGFPTQPYGAMSGVLAGSNAGQAVCTSPAERTHYRGAPRPRTLHRKVWVGSFGPGCFSAVRELMAT